MNDGVIPAVKMFDSFYYIFYILFHLMLWQSSVVFELIMDGTSLGILKEKVDLVLFLEGLMELYDFWVVQALEDGDFPLNFFAMDVILHKVRVYFFKGERFSIDGHLEDLAEAPFRDVLLIFPLFSKIHSNLSQIAI